MGHKVHPIGIRLGIARDWNSKWYATKKDFATYLIADIKTRDMLRAKLVQAGISRIQIERPATGTVPFFSPLCLPVHFLFLRVPRVAS